MRHNGLAVHRDYHRIKIAKIQPEYPGICRIDQAQANTFTSLNRHAIRYLAIYRDSVSDPTAMHSIALIAEIIRELTVVCHPPVIQHPGHITVHADRFSLFDNQRTIKAATQLFETALMRVVPECSRIQSVELILEITINRDRVLCKKRHPIHRIWRTNAMPMNGRPLLQTVFSQNAYPVALTDPDFRTGNGTVITPDVSQAVWCRAQSGLRGCGAQTKRLVGLLRHRCPHRRHKRY